MHNPASVVPLSYLPLSVSLSLSRSCSFNERPRIVYFSWKRISRISFLIVWLKEINPLVRRRRWQWHHLEASFPLQRSLHVPLPIVVKTRHVTSLCPFSSDRNCNLSEQFHRFWFLPFSISSPQVLMLPNQAAFPSERVNYTALRSQLAKTGHVRSRNYTFVHLCATTKVPLRVRLEGSRLPGPDGRRGRMENRGRQGRWSGGR